MTHAEERCLILIAKLSALKGIAKSRGELTLYALIDAMLEHEVNS